ncbi:MAG: BNR-4 repeat-containing protein [Planctomycetia bacterium]|jgi:hypothetical protein
MKKWYLLTIFVTALFVTALSGHDSALYATVNDGGSKATASDQDQTLKSKDAGYRGIWYTLGQYTSDLKNKKYRHTRYWKYGDKNCGGLGTGFVKHVPIAVYAPEVKKTFFVYGGSKNGETHLYNMVSYYDHEKDRVPRPTILHDKQTVDDPHDDSALAIDEQGHIWVYVAGRARKRPGFVYRSVKPYDIDRFELISEEEMCYPQPHPIRGKGTFEFFTQYKKITKNSNRRVLYWRFRDLDGTCSDAHELSKMEREGQYQTSFEKDGRVITMFNRHPNGIVDKRTDLYYLETRDLGKTWQTVDGVTVKTPLVKIDNPALVKAYSKENRMVYLNSITLDNDGNPLALIVTSSDHRPGPQGDPRTWEVLHHKDGKWNIHKVTDSTNNYDTGPIWVDSDGTWRIIGPTDPGPQRWGPGGEVAIWLSRDEGKTWTKTRQVTNNSPRNHAYVRKVFGATPDSSFFALWADGNADEKSASYLYFTNRAGTIVRKLPYDMEGDFATPDVVK